MKKILVIGASRGIGQAVCKAALEANYTVRAMSRRPGTSSGANANYEAVAGDALNRADVASALEGVDVVVQALGVPPSLELITGPITLFSQATEVLVPAMEEENVEKLIAVTGFGAGDSNSRINVLQRLPFNLFLGKAYDDKSKQEALIERSNLDWLIVRPGVLTNRPASGQYRILREPREWRNGIVSRADVADYIVKAVAADELGRQKPVIIQYPL
ncbi:MAG: NAD(P)H-binding protein [Pseudomonadota bacterium]